MKEVTIMGVKLPIADGLVIPRRVIVRDVVVTIVKEVTVTRLLLLLAVQLVDPLDMQLMFGPMLKKEELK
jgi:hypothetical protein